MRPTRLWLATLALALLSVGSAAADPVTIRQAWARVPNLLTPAVFENKAVLLHWGKSYVVEPIIFAGTSPQITAVAAGEVDIVTSGFSTFAVAIQNAGITDLRIIADGFQDGIEGHLSSPYFVRNDSGIKTIEDLKGKVLASNAIGGSLDIALRAMLRKHGLEDKRDYSIVEAQFATMGPMLLDGKIALASMSPPFIYDPKLTGSLHSLFTMRDAVGPTQMIVLAAREPFLEKNRAAVIDFFEDMLRGAQWFLDPAHRDEAIALVARMIKQPPERLATYLYTDKDYFHDPHGLPNLAALQHDMQTQRDLGFLKADLDVRKYTDLSLITEASKRLE